MPRTNYSVTLRNLLDAGLLQDGEELVCEPSRGTGAFHYARLTRDGMIDHEGNAYANPSRWAVALAAGAARNGWIYVFARGKQLSEYRDAFQNAAVGQTNRPAQNSSPKSFSEAYRQAQLAQGAGKDRPMTPQKRTTLRDLIDAELLQVGEELVFEPSKGAPLASGSLSYNGSIDHNGRYFDTPSSWAKSITGREHNGWICVFARGKPLSEYRDAHLKATAETSTLPRGRRTQSATRAYRLAQLAEGGNEPNHDAHANIDSPAPMPPRISVEYATRADIDVLRTEINALQAQIADAPMTPFAAPNIGGLGISETLLDRVLNLSSYQFEHLVGEFLKAKGFSNVEVTQRSQDGGIDGHCEMPFLNLRVAFQAKRWQRGNNVGSKPVQELQGAIMFRGFDRGLLVTTSDFSPAAKGLLEETPQAQITLVNGDELVRQLIALGLGVKTSSVVRQELDDGFFDDLKRS